MNQRGQSLVLMSLSLLLVVTMAMMTLGIGQRVREKIELQTMADAAAYTDATLVARTYNEISLSNRGIVGDEVALASTYSLVSYALSWTADVNAAKAALGEAKGYYQDIVDDCRDRGLPASNARCKCASDALSNSAWGAARGALDGELSRLGSMPLDALDYNATAQANNYRDHAIAMHEHAQMFLNEELSFKVSPYQVAKTYARAAKARQGEMKAPLANDAISLREARKGVVDQQDGPEHRQFVDVGRGTRYQFVLKRTDGAPMNGRFATILAAAGAAGVTITAAPNGTADWVAADSMLEAKDTTTVRVGFNAAGAACGSSSATRQVTSSLMTAPNAHRWPTGADVDPKRHELQACDTAPQCTPPPPQLYDWSTLGNGTDPPDPRCTQPQCQRSENLGDLPRLATAARMAQAMAEALPCDPCPGVWPAYLGLQLDCADDPNDLYCQPKQYAILQRDYSQREHPDPWNLAYRFHLSAEGESVDLKRLQLRDGTDISRQTAVAGGLAYYHYQGGAKWEESPNLLNPFWRSTLAPMDIDAAGNPRAVPTPGKDIPNFFLQSVNPQSPTSTSAAVLSREVFLELIANGYQGIQ